MLLSIIIPAYKVEPFIEKCLKSCLNQKDVSPEDYEIIVVNDGSPDRSGEIAETILHGRRNSKVIHQENQGLSGARNTGIALARGEYIWFVDSDDWIEHNALDSIFRSIENYNYPDVIMVRAESNDSSGNSTVRHNDWSNTLAPQIGKDIFMSGDWLICAQFFIVKRKFLNEYSLKFMRGVFHEDNEYTPRMLFFADKVVRLNKILYHSFVNDQSITHTINPKRAFDLLKVCDSLSKFVSDNDMKGPLLTCYNDFISLSLNNALSIMQTQDSNIIAKFNVAMAEYKNLLGHLRKSRKLKYKIEGFLFPFVTNYCKWYSCLLTMK